MDELINLLKSPPFFISILGPTIINISYYILRGRLSEYVTNPTNDHPDISYRKLLLEFLNKTEFKTVFAHSIQLMILFAATVFFAVDIITKCWEHNSLQIAMRSYWKTDNTFRVLFITIIIYFIFLLISVGKGALATEKAIQSYDEKEKEKKWQTRQKLYHKILFWLSNIFPPVNLISFYRLFLFVLIIYYNRWLPEHG